MSEQRYYCEECARWLSGDVFVIQGKPGHLYHLRSVPIPMGRISVECGPVVPKEEPE